MGQHQYTDNTLAFQLIFHKFQSRNVLRTKDSIFVKIRTLHHPPHPIHSRKPPILPQNDPNRRPQILGRHGRLIPSLQHCDDQIGPGFPKKKRRNAVQVSKA
jgi:hypothetical protein